MSYASACLITKLLTRTLGIHSVATGGKATTSKYFYADVKARFPAVEWVPSARWIVSDNGKLWWSSGGISVLDGIYAFQRVVYGTEAAVWGANVLEYVAHSDPSVDPFAELWRTT